MSNYVASDDLRDALSVLYLTSAHLRSIGIDIPVRVIIYHQYRTYIMSRVEYCVLGHPQGRGVIIGVDLIVLMMDFEFWADFIRFHRLQQRGAVPNILGAAEDMGTTLSEEIWT
nr:hypothetical protein [Tanacetum cinerariifolium]